MQINIKKIFSHWFFLALVFLVFNIFFNRHIILELFQKDEHRSQGQDGLIAQYLIENSYQNLKAGKSIFAENQKIFYPFGSQIVANDIGFIYVFWFVIFRSFLTINQSLQLAIFICFFLCEIVTYLFLRYLKISKKISFVFSLVFSFAPFVSYIRIDQHYNYLQHYLFPLNSLLILLVLRENKEHKIWHAIFLGISLSLFVYSTYYYFVMFGFLVFFYLIFWRIINHDWQYNYEKYKQNLKYFLVASFVFFICILPFINGFWNLYKLNNLPIEKSSIESVIYFSARNFSFLIPSPTNLFIGKYVNNELNFLNNVEGTSYLGIIILMGIISYLKNREKKLMPIFLVGIIFYLLSLGPILNFAKPGSSQFDLEVVNFFKLPYFWISKLPVLKILSMLRAPIRLAVPLTFCLMIVSSFSYEKVIKNLYNKNFIFIILIFILIFDHTYKVERKFNKLNLPYKAYQIIRNDSENCTVFEIPFVVQDGLNKFGDHFHANFMYGQLLHDKNIIGGYVPRINKKVFEFYVNLPLIRYYGYLSSEELQKRIKLEKPNLNLINKNLTDLKVKYIILRKDFKKYGIEDDLAKMSYLKEIEDGDFILFKKINFNSWEV